ncbi:MAG: N-acetyltransferase [Chloracidobacterium sp.]|nr:N-acetyltransferase [Chloracidobacterium sp.]
MEIQQEEHGRKGAFFIEEDGEWVAEMTYVRRGEDTIVIDHTEVDPKLGGQGIGRRLVEAGVKFARENGFKIKPLCPYARKVIESTPEFQDVLS